MREQITTPEALYAVTGWRHARWFEPHAAMPTDVFVRLPGGTGTNPLMAICSTCGEVLLPNTFSAHPDALARAKAEALREHRRRVARFMPAGLVDRATVLADLDHYADRIDPTEAPVTDHDFLPVAGHPDDNECTYRNDGTDLTYCGEPKEAHR